MTGAKLILLAGVVAGPPAIAQATHADLPPWLMPVLVGLAVAFVTWSARRNVDSADDRVAKLVESLNKATGQIAAHETQIALLKRDMAHLGERLDWRNELRSLRRELDNRKH